MKACKTCGETKPLEGFHRHPAYKDGRNGHCKECFNAKMRAKYSGEEGKRLQKIKNDGYRKRAVNLPDLTYPDRYWAKVERRGPDECWPWLGAMGGRGAHGTINVRGRTQYAHRIAYEFAKGPIPEGLVIDHTCRNYACQNPAHLRAVTPGVNAIENNDNPFAKNKRKTHCSKGHEFRPETTAVVEGKAPRGTKTINRHCLICFPAYWNHPRRIFDTESARGPAS